MPLLPPFNPNPNPDPNPNPPDSVPVAQLAGPAPMAPYQLIAEAYKSHFSSAHEAGRIEPSRAIAVMYVWRLGLRDELRLNRLGVGPPATVNEV